MLSGFNPSSRNTVLIADDCPEIRDYLRILLESEGYNVDSACDGAEAIQVLQAGSAARLALLDMQMPGMDGIQTLRCLRQLRPQIKVIICSGVAEPDTIRKAIAAGAHAYLVKPVHRLYLSAAIQHCLNDEPPPIFAEGSGGRLLMFALPSSDSLPN